MSVSNWDQKIEDQLFASDSPSALSHSLKSIREELLQKEKRKEEEVLVIFKCLGKQSQSPCHLSPSDSELRQFLQDDLTFSVSLQRFIETFKNDKSKFDLQRAFEITELSELETYLSSLNLHLPLLSYYTISFEGYQKMDSSSRIDTETKQSLLLLIDFVTFQLKVPSLFISSIGLLPGDSQSQKLLTFFRKVSVLFRSLLFSLFNILVPSLCFTSEKEEDSSEDSVKEDSLEHSEKEIVKKVALQSLIHRPLFFKLPSLSMIHVLESGVIHASFEPKKKEDWYRWGEVVPPWGVEDEDSKESNSLFCLLKQFFALENQNASLILDQVFTFLREEMALREKSEEFLDLAYLLMNLVSLISESFPCSSIPSSVSTSSSLFSSSNPSSSSLNSSLPFISLHIHTIIPMALRMLKIGDDHVSSIALGILSHVIFLNNLNFVDPFIGVLLHEFRSCLGRREGVFPNGVLPLFLCLVCRESHPSSQSSLLCDSHCAQEIEKEVERVTPSKTGYECMERLLQQAQRSHGPVKSLFLDSLTQLVDSFGVHSIRYLEKLVGLTFQELEIASSLQLSSPSSSLLSSLRLLRETVRVCWPRITSFQNAIFGALYRLYSEIENLPPEEITDQTRSAQTDSLLTFNFLFRAAKLNQKKDSISQIETLFKLANFPLPES